MCSDTESDADMLSTKSKVLKYCVHSYSNFLPPFEPENVLENDPKDQNSRWSVECNNSPQFLTLKLENLAIIKSITFGKYEEAHASNMKKFQVFGGMTENTQIKLLDGGLNNDNCPETFILSHELGGLPFPCRYLKIVPLQPWVGIYYFSIWYIRLNGSDNLNEVQKAAEWFNSYREREIVRLCLKHFRLLNYQEVFNDLAQVTSVKLEDNLLSKLFDLLVMEGDFDASELFMEKAVAGGFLDIYISKQGYHPVWKLIKGEEIRPGVRGGHQMCYDQFSESVFLLGGWDGHQDLSDFWSFHIPSSKWKLISYDVESEGGPGPRSCHKMCCHYIRREIYVLGRYLDGLYRTPYNLKSDFYVYNIESNRWTLIIENTQLVGGPALIFDHQMCMDVENSVLYVFGGRIVMPFTIVNSNEERPANEIGPFPPEQMFSGLYSYHITSNIWRYLSSNFQGETRETKSILKPRAGHCMLFHTINRKLYIFHGQQNSKEHLTDFISFNVDTEEIEMISDFIKQDKTELPPTGFTQRATIDSSLNEIYVLSGLSKDKEKRDGKAQNSLWVYSLNKYKWTCVYKNENASEQYWSRMQYVEPCPRYAHQLVYDDNRKVHFLFGGNPGRMCLPKLRLDDFWSLELCRTKHHEMLQQCKLLIRKCRFQELSRTDKLEAVEFLHSEFSPLISNIEQEEQLQSMACLLFSEKKVDVSEQSELDEETKVKHRNRYKLFQKLSSFFPESMTEPKMSLIDMITL